METPVLETERLILRAFTEADLEALYAIYSDEEVNRFLPWFPVKTLEDARIFYETRLAADCGSAYHYAICRKADSYPIGYVNAPAAGSHDLGYGLRKEFWHQGIVTEAGKAVIEQLRRDGAAYVTATHDVNNPRSGEIMKRLGMRYQYSYEELWQPKNFLVTFRLYQLNLDGDEGRVYKKYWDTSAVHWIEANL